MADSDKLDSDELGEVDDPDTAEQAETTEDADVVNRAAEGGADAAGADLAEVDDASAKRTEGGVKDVTTKGSDEDGEPEETPTKGKRGKKHVSKEDAAKGSSKKDGSSEEETTEKGSRARRKQEKSSAESSRKGSKKSSRNSGKKAKRSTEKRAAGKKASSKERKPARVKGLQSSKQWAPLLITLMIIGLVIVVTAYVFGNNFPIKGLGNGNLFIDFGFMFTGFLMTMGWKRRPPSRCPSDPERTVAAISCSRELGPREAPLPTKPRKARSGITPYSDDDDQRFAKRHEGDDVDDPPLLR